MNSGLGRIGLVFVTLVCVVLIASNIGYKVGHASGVFEANTKYEKALLDDQIAQVSAATSPYSDASDNPVADVKTNPFDY